MTLEPLGRSKSTKSAGFRKSKKASGFRVAPSRVESKPIPSSSSVQVSSSLEEIEAEVELTGDSLKQLTELNNCIRDIVKKGSLARRITSNKERKKNSTKSSSESSNEKMRKILLDIQDLWNDTLILKNAKLKKLLERAVSLPKMSRNLAESSSIDGSKLTSNVFNELILVAASIEGVSPPGDYIKINNTVIFLPPSHYAIAQSLLFLLLCIATLRFCKRMLTIYNMNIDEAWPKITAGKN